MLDREDVEVPERLQMVPVSGFMYGEYIYIYVYMYMIYTLNPKMLPKRSVRGLKPVSSEYGTCKTVKARGRGPAVGRGGREAREERDHQRRDRLPKLPITP